jgi:hypothetical protein
MLSAVVGKSECLPALSEVSHFHDLEKLGPLASTIKIFFIPGRSPWKPIKPGLFLDNWTHHEELTN